VAAHRQSPKSSVLSKLACTMASAEPDSSERDLMQARGGLPPSLAPGDSALNRTSCARSSITGDSVAAVGSARQLANDVGRRAAPRVVKRCACP
jgi:hypothetical protein